MPQIVVPTNPSSLVSTLNASPLSTPQIWVHDLFGVQVGTWSVLRVSKFFTAVSHDFEHMVSHPESGKSSAFRRSRLLPTYFMASFSVCGARQTNVRSE